MKLFNRQQQREIHLFDWFSALITHNDTENDVWDLPQLLQLLFAYLFIYLVSALLLKIQKKYIWNENENENKS